MSDTATAPTTQPTQKQMVETDRQVCLVRYSPDGRYLFGGGFDATVRRWDLSEEEPQQLDPLTGHNGWVQTLNFAPDGSRLLTADSWGQLRTWNVDGESVTEAWSNQKAHDGWVRAIAISPDGNTVASGGTDRVIRLWSASDGKLIRELPGHIDDVFCLTFHPDGQSLVSADFLSNLKHWNVATGECVRDLHVESMHLYERIQDVAGIRVLQFEDEGATLLVAGSTPERAGRMIGIPTIHRLNWESLETEKSWHLGANNHGYVFDLAQHPDGYYIVATSGQPGNGQFLLLRPDEDEPFFTHTKIANCHSVALHPDNRTVIVATINPRNQGNGAVRDKDGNYLGNWTPLYVFDLAADGEAG